MVDMHPDRPTGPGSRQIKLQKITSSELLENIVDVRKQEDKATLDAENIELSARY